MRVMFLSQRVPYPPTKGDKLRAYHELKAIAEHHEVDLFTLADDPADLEHAGILGSFCRTVTICRIVPRVARLLSLRVLGTGRPLTLPYFHSGELKGKVSAALAEGRHDRVFVFCSSMAQYIGDFPVPTLLDLVDVDSDKWDQYATRSRLPMAAIYRRESKCLRAYERKVCTASGCVAVTTEREARLARELAPQARVEVLRNGVDAAFFRVNRNADVRGNELVFTGDMSYLPNEEAVVWFAKEAMPLIRREIPDVRLSVVGRNPAKRVMQLGNVPGVEVLGYVPDVRPYLARAQVAVAPLRIAAGVQNKVLEAMACQLPVVGTSLAVQGLSPAVAALVERADTAPELAASCVKLLKHPEMAQNRGSEARHVVTAEYNWQSTGTRLLHILENLA